MSVEDSDPCTCLRELVTILVSGDDEEEIKMSSKCCYKAADFKRENEMVVQKYVEELARRREVKTKLLMSHLQENQENQDVIVSLESERNDAVSNIENLNSEVGSVEETMKQTQKAASQVKEEKASIQHDTTEVLPKTKYAFSLYSNITRLRWDYESGEHELKGFVASLRDVRPFTLNIEDNTKYFTANYLWDVIASS